MRKAEPKLKLNLAQKALYRYFEKNMYSEEYRQSIMQYCKENMTNENLIKLSMRIMKEQNNNKIIKCILNEASEEERQFLYNKYKQNLTFVAIAMKLHVHPNGLQRWRDKFLTEIAIMLFYELPANDIYSIAKIKLLIEVLAENIEFLEGTYKGKADPNVLNTFRIRKEKYQQILDRLEYIQKNTPKDSLEQIIKLKLKYTNASVEELAKKSGFSTGTICEKLNRFSVHYCSETSKGTFLR